MRELWFQRSLFSSSCFVLVSATVKPRHKSHLVYQFTESQEMNNVVSQATLNIFVYSRKYLRSSDLQLPKNFRLIDIEVAKVLQGSQHKMIFETFRNISIPDGGGSDGDYVQLNITDLVSEWFSSRETSHGLSVKIIASRTGAALPHKIVSLDAENFSTVSKRNPKLCCMHISPPILLSRDSKNTKFFAAHIMTYSIYRSSLQSHRKI